MCSERTPHVGVPRRLSCPETATLVPAHSTDTSILEVGPESCSGSGCEKVDKTGTTGYGCDDDGSKMPEDKQWKVII